MDSYLVTNSPVDKPRTFYSGNNFTQIHRQAIITVNANADNTTFNRRKESNKKLQSQKYGSLTNDRFLDIFPMELVFVEKGPNLSYVARTTTYLGKSNKHVKVFSSFNGLALNGATSKEEFKRRFRPIGYAQGPFFYNSSEQPKHGLAVTAGGSGTTYNNGTDELQPMDKMVWDLKSIDEARRIDEDEKYPRFHGQPEGKLTAIIKKFDHRMVTGIASDAAEFILDTDHIEHSKLHNLDRGARANLSLIQRVGLNLKHSVLHMIFNAIITLRQYGILSINTPSATRPLESTFYNNFDSVLGNPLDVVNKYDVVFNRENRQLEILSDRESNKKLRSREGEWLAHIIGLVSNNSVSGKHLQQSNQLVNAILGRALCGLIRDDAVRQYFSNAHYFDSGTKTRTRARNSYGQLKAFNDRTFAGILAYNQDSAAKRFAHAHTQLTHELLNQIVGASLGYSKPGERTDYAKYH